MGAAKSIRVRLSPAGNGGKGEARRTMASAASSKMLAPLPRTSETESTWPLRSRAKRTVAIPVTAAAARGFRIGAEALQMRLNLRLIRRHQGRAAGLDIASISRASGRGGSGRPRRSRGRARRRRPRLGAPHFLGCGLLFHRSFFHRSWRFDGLELGLFLDHAPVGSLGVRQGRHALFGRRFGREWRRRHGARNRLGNRPRFRFGLSRLGHCGWIGCLRFRRRGVGGRGGRRQRAVRHDLDRNDDDRTLGRRHRRIAERALQIVLGPRSGARQRRPHVAPAKARWRDGTSRVPSPAQPAARGVPPPRRPRRLARGTPRRSRPAPSVAPMCSAWPSFDLVPLQAALPA